MSTIYEQREKGYNGWANYETWRVNLEMFDGYDPTDFFNGYDFADGDFDNAVRDLAHMLEDMADEIIESEIPNPKVHGFAYDLAMSFLSKVDFHEIAEHMANDYAAEVLRPLTED